MQTPRQWHARFQQQARWTQPVRRFLSEQLGISRGSRGLEVGCGSGVIAAEIQAARGARIHGIDIRYDFLRLASELDPSLSLIQADAHYLPYASGSFDFTFCHYFLLWMADPLLVLREMRRVIRSGGFVFAAAEPDYGGRVDFPVELAVLGQLQADALRHQGAEPQIGRRLACLFHEAGLINVRCGVLGGQWGDPAPAEEVLLEWKTLAEDLRGEISTEELNEYRRADAQAWQTGDRVLYVPTFYAWGYVS